MRLTFAFGLPTFLGLSGDSDMVSDEADGNIDCAGFLKAVMLFFLVMGVGQYVGKSPRTAMPRP